jgi:hypothetical protein
LNRLRLRLLSYGLYSNLKKKQLYIFMRRLATATARKIVRLLMARAPVPALALQHYDQYPLTDRTQSEKPLPVLLLILRYRNRNREEKLL